MGKKEKIVKPCDVVKAGQQISKYVRTTEKVKTLRLCSMPRKPWADIMLAYKKHAGNIRAGLKDTGYFWITN